MAKKKAAPKAKRKPRKAAKKKRPVGRPKGRKKANQTADKRTAIKKRFLEALAENGSTRHAAAAVEIGRSTIYEWRQADPDFDAACEEAYDASTCQLEESMHTRAMKGDTTAAIFLLKARRPERYRDRHEYVIKEYDLDAEIERRLANLAPSRQTTLVGAADGNGRGADHRP